MLPISFTPSLDFDAPDIGCDVSFFVLARIRESCLWLKAVVSKPNECSKFAEMTNEVAVRCVPVMSRIVAIALEGLLGEKLSNLLGFRVEGQALNVQRLCLWLFLLCKFGIDFSLCHCKKIDCEWVFWIGLASDDRKQA